MQRIKIIAFLIISVITIGCDDTPQNYSSVSGTWRCQDFDPLVGYVSPYFVNITKSSTNENQYIIDNFFNVDINEPIIAQLSKDTLLINSEQIISSTIVKSGKGIISNNYKRIDFTYKVDDEKGERTINGTYTR